MRALLLLGLTACGAGLIGPRADVDRVAYPNGKARFEFELRDGVPNGRGRGWYPNGKLASDGTYQNGARNGRFWLYNEDGSFAAQAIYFENEEVWRSTDEHATPPDEWVKGMELTAEHSPSDATMVTTGLELNAEANRRSPRAYFSTLDRTTAAARAGAQLGVGAAKDLDFGAATRFDMFGHYRFGPYGVFAQVSETHLYVADNMTYAGRMSSLVAGTYHRPLGPAVLSTNAGMIVPLNNANPQGSVASYAGAEQRAGDAAFAVPAPFGVRSGASLTATRGIFVAQVDAGFDWMLGGDQNGLDAVGRVNVGVGMGTRSTLLTAELDNAFHLRGRSDQLQTFAVGGTIAFPVVYLSACLAFSADGLMSFIGSVGHDL